MVCTVCMCVCVYCVCTVWVCTVCVCGGECTCAMWGVNVYMYVNDTDKLKADVINYESHYVLVREFCTVL